jgi:hypothetical protein
MIGLPLNALLQIDRNTVETQKSRSARADDDVFGCPATWMLLFRRMSSIPSVEAA